MQVLESKINNLDDYYSALDEYKDKNNYFKKELRFCYDVVESFIRRQNRVLVGGMAIDMALKLKGSKLYNVEKIDYDFLSPEFHRDAYAIANELAEKFDNIDAIGALHVSTMRVRYKFMPVADITYQSPNLFDKLLTLDYDGFRIVHPKVQFIDQLISVSNMLDNPPMEAFFSDRLTKDTKRMLMLLEHYEVDITGVESKMVTKEISKDVIKGQCLYGAVSLAYWLNKLDIETNMKFNASGSTILCELPDVENIGILTDSPEEFDDYKLIKKTKPLLDKIREFDTREIDMLTHLDVYNNRGKKTIAHKIGDIYVADIYPTLVWAMSQEIYRHRTHLVPATSKLFNALIDDLKKDKKLFPTNPTFFGEHVWSESYILALKRAKFASKRQKLTGILPRAAYPKKGEVIKEDFYDFEPEDSSVLANNGMEEIVEDNEKNDDSDNDTDE